MQPLGAIMLICAYLAYCLTSLVMYTFVQNGTSLFMAFGFQNILVFAFLLMRMLFVKTKVEMPKEPTTIFLRSITGLLYSLCYLQALQSASFAEVGVLTNSFPLFVVLIAWLFLGERVSISQVVALVCGMIGVWCILLPGAQNVINNGMGFATLASLFWAISLIIMQKVTDLEQVYSYMLFFFGFTVMLIMPMMIKNFSTPSYNDLFFYSTAAFLSLLAQFLVFQAYKLCSAAELAPYNFSYAIFHFIVAKGLFSFVPTNSFYIGAFLVLIGAVVNLIVFEKRDEVKNIEDENTSEIEEIR